MRRRDLLASLGAVATAGCTAGYTASDPVDRRETGTVTAIPLAKQGRPRDICEEELKPEGFLAVENPAFGSPEEWPDDPDDYRPLTRNTPVIGLTHDGDARAYPMNMLNAHEVVNDEFGGPVIVTYCPICRSGMVADRRVDGVSAIFDVSGLLWKPPRVYTAASEQDGRVFSDRQAGVGNNGNLVMYDGATGSYWSQMLATGICGPEAGTRLGIRPSSVATLEEWLAEYPDTAVLLPQPQSSVVDPPVTGDHDDSA
jgi:hypothetical protein